MENIELILLDNHLAFLASHRGSISRNKDTLFIESDRPEFTYAILGQNSKLEELPLNVQTVQHLPWSETTTDNLNEVGLKTTFGLSYMMLGENLPEWRVRSDLHIERVKDTFGMDAFSDVQSRGFNETIESYEHWRSWLKAANYRNLQNPNQYFYIGTQSGVVVGVVLMVIEEKSAGIYAVATLPEHRKKGISTTIMKQAVAEARKIGLSTITLQVKQDSYVEDFYKHLGFKRIFTTGIYRRN
jgi:N-acetylglutamate synthase-like GNAT family acetyltransferase